MSKELENYLKQNQDAEIDFKLSLENTKVRVNGDGTFKITWEPSKEQRHQWYSDDGSSGKVSTQYLPRNHRWVESTGDTTGIGEKYRYGDGFSLEDNDGDKKIIGVMPNGKGDNLFLYEQSPITLKNGKAHLGGRLLSSQLVVEYAEELAYAFGEKVIRNHLLVDRGLIDRNLSSREYLSSIKSLDVTSAFWEDIDQLNDEIINFKGVNTDSQKVLSSNGNQIRLSSWWDDAINDATDWAEASSSNGNQALLSSFLDDFADAVEDGYNEATDYTEDLFDDADEIFVTPVEDVIDDGTGPIKFTETIDFDLISQRHEKAPFYTIYDAIASVTVDIVLNNGYLGALDPKTISVRVTPNIDVSASAGLELDPLVQTYNGSIDGPHYEVLNPVVGEVTLSSRLDYEFEAVASVGEGVGAGVAVEASPEATLSFNIDLINPDAKFTDVKDNYNFTEDFDRLFNNFDPKGELVAKITPVLNVTALPVIPKDVPTVGGMGLANVGVSYLNPIIFRYETTDPLNLQGSISGAMEPEVSVLGQKIGGIPSLDIYETDFTLSFG